MEMTTYEKEVVFREYAKKLSTHFGTLILAHEAGAMVVRMEQLVRDIINDEKKEAA